MQLHDHALGQLLHPRIGFDLGVRQRGLAFGTVKTRMHPLDKIDGLRHPYPARQHRHVGNETHLLHQRVAMGPRVQAEHTELTLERDQPKNRLQRGGLAGAIGTDQADDTTGRQLEADPVHRDGVLVAFAQIACADDTGHYFSSAASAAFIRDLISSPSRRMRSSTNGHSRSEEHTSELQSLMRTSYAAFCLKKNKTINT